jgi:hypothetical protein
MARQAQSCEVLKDVVCYQRHGDGHCDQKDIEQILNIVNHGYPFEKVNSDTKIQKKKKCLGGGPCSGGCGAGILFLPVVSGRISAAMIRREISIGKTGNRRGERP